MKKKMAIPICVAAAVALIAGGGAGFYFGVYARDFKVTSGDIFTQVYPGDFYEQIPYSDYLSEVDAPADVFDIRTYGAVPDDPAINNSAAINQAIADCAAAGGGTVYVGGGSYTAGSVVLLSNVTLFIDTGAALIASHNSGDFDKGCLLLCENAQNVRLTGGGKICGEGNYYSLAPREQPKLTPFDETLGVWEMRQEYRYRIRFAHESKYGNLVRFVNCSGISIDNFMMENSAAWTLELNGCDGVRIRDLVIDNNRHVANTDGIDVAGSSNVSIEHCFISTGDDGIVLKHSESLGGNRPVMENVTVRDCKVTTCTNAFKIGTETSLDIRSVLVEDCDFFLTDLYPGGVSGISIESADGAQIQDVTVRDIRMENELCPLFISLNNRNRDGNRDNAGAISGITIENIQASGIEMPVIITGTRQLNVGDVTIRNFSCTYAPGEDYYDYRPFVPAYETSYPECNRMRNLNAYALWARNVDTLTLEDFSVVPRADTRREEMILRNVAHFQTAARDIP